MPVALFVANLPAHPGICGWIAAQADRLAYRGATVGSSVSNGRILFDAVAYTCEPDWPDVEQMLDQVCDMVARTGGTWEEVQAVAM